MEVRDGAATGHWKVSAKRCKGEGQGVTARHRLEDRWVEVEHGAARGQWWTAQGAAQGRAAGQHGERCKEERRVAREQTWVPPVAPSLLDEQRRQATRPRSRRPVHQPWSTSTHQIEGIGVLRVSQQHHTLPQSALRVHCCQQPAIKQQLLTG